MPVQFKAGEGFVNPIGYYETKARFSWQLARQETFSLHTYYGCRPMTNLPQNRFIFAL
ncbi:MAG: hypothetical protein HKN34_10530 [Gammaproteobacteria bacterium]|nr:hypothetical protein [Gammaproteobacteria bacterium]